MTETAKERIYREAFEEIKRVCDTQDHVDNHLLRFFITKKMMEIEKLPSTTDKLSVEKLQERCDRYEMALTEIKEIIKNNTHHCDFGCDNNCEMDGALHSYAVKELNQALAAIGGDDD